MICVIRDVLSGLELKAGCGRECGRTPVYSFMLKLSFLFQIRAENPAVKMKLISPSSQLKYAQGREDAHRLQTQLRCSQPMGP